MEKCLHILPMNKLSGAEKMALILCKNLKKFKPIVVCGGEILSEVFKKQGIESYHMTFSNKKLFINLSNLKDIIEKNNIKIIHAHDNNASLNAYLVKKIYRLNIKVVSHIHSCYPFLKSNKLIKRIDRYLRPRYDINITCGNLVYDFYKNNADYFKKEKFLVLSNAIDLNEIKNLDSNERDELRFKFNIPKDKTILGFVGRLCNIKGIIPFIEAFNKHKNDFENCRVLLIGSGDEELKIKQLIKELELDEFFILTGFQENVYKFYSLIDIFFLPSIYEGLPMVLLEAMAFKKSVISMNVGSISEIIDEQRGVLVEAGDYENFIYNLKKLKKDKEKVINYGMKAYEFVIKNYNAETYINNIEKIYSDLLIS